MLSGGGWIPYSLQPAFNHGNSAFHDPRKRPPPDQVHNSASSRLASRGPIGRGKRQMVRAVSVKRLSSIRRAQILSLMVEGVSLRAISRLAGAGRNTLARMLTEFGSVFLLS
jgi:hypothetical protein